MTKFSYEMPELTREQRIAANHRLIRTWIDDTPTHELSDRYVRTMLTGLVVRGRRCEPSPDSVRVVAAEERAAAEAATDGSTRVNCGASADVLYALADKLHELGSE
jgi:hypothetical protein